MAAEPSFQGIQELGLEAFERARALEEHPDDCAICSDSPSVFTLLGTVTPKARVQKVDLGQIALDWRYRTSYGPWRKMPRPWPFHIYPVLCTISQS